MARSSAQNSPLPDSLPDDIRRWGLELGFGQIGFADTDLGQYEAPLNKQTSGAVEAKLSSLRYRGSATSRPAATRTN